MNQYREKLQQQALDSDITEAKLPSVQSAASGEGSSFNTFSSTGSETVFTMDEDVARERTRSHGAGDCVDSIPETPARFVIASEADDEDVDGCDGDDDASTDFDGRQAAVEAAKSRGRQRHYTEPASKQHLGLFVSTSICKKKKL